MTDYRAVMDLVLQGWSVRQILGLSPLDAATVHQLLNILDGRERKVSTIVTSQFTPHEWCKSISDAVISESILNRLVSGTEIITLEGPNMRLTTNA
mgnify:CR=1 FL=1